MPKYAYVANDASVKEVKGKIDADSRQDAIAKVRAMKLVPTALGEVKESNVTAARPAAKRGKGMSMEIKLPSFLRGRVKAKELAEMTRQLATLVNAGLPLMRALRVLQKQCTNASLKEALQGMEESVSGGSTFSESLTAYPKIFNHLYINMVKAGEAGGVLETVLNRLAEFAEKAEKIKGKVKSAMIYPIVVLLAAVGITGFLLVKVIPKFQEIFDDLLGGGGLPAVTEFVINASNLVKEHGVATVVLIAGLCFLFRIARMTKQGHYFLDAVALRLPGFGQLTRKSAISRMTRTLGTLLSSGVPVLQALTIVRDTAGNDVVARAIQAVHDSVKEGESMAGPMAASGIFPPMVISMVEVGEETGALPDMFVRIANTYDDEVDNAVAGMTSVIEPLMIVFLAVVVGTIVIAMFLPLIKIIGSLSQQAG